MKTKTRQPKRNGHRAPRVNRTGMREYFVAQPGIVAAYLFGSVAKGSFRDHSDVDIAVLIDPHLDTHERSQRYMNLLRGELDQFADRAVDVRLLNDASPLFCFLAVRQAQVIYERSREERIAFDVLAMTNYADTQPLRDFFTRDVYRRIREGRLGERRKSNHPNALETARRIHARITRAATRGV